MAVVNAETHKRKFSENKPPPQGSGNTLEAEEEKLEARKEGCTLLCPGYETALVRRKHSRSDYLHKIKPGNIPHA